MATKIPRNGNKELYIFKSIPQGLQIFGFLLFLAIVLGIILVPKWQADQVTQDPEKHFEVENKARTTIVQVVGGAFFFVTAYFSLQNLRVASQNLRIAEENRQIAEGEKITGRFVKAVEMLTDKDKLDIRLGGIYSLERIARDSESDRWTVLEVLTAYIRRRCYIHELDGLEHMKTTVDIPSFLDTIFSDPCIPSFLDIICTIEPHKTVEEDIQAALSIIGKWQTPKGKKINLSQTDLRKVDLEGAKLARASLSSAILSQANLNRACLSKADISGSLLNNAHLIQATLRGTRAIGCSFTGALFIGADLRETCFIGAKLKEAIFYGADLEGSELCDADLDEADLRWLKKKLTCEQVKKAKNWESALYDPEFAAELGLSADEQRKKVDEKELKLKEVRYLLLTIPSFSGFDNLELERQIFGISRLSNSRTKKHLKP